MIFIQIISFKSFGFPTFGTLWPVFHQAAWKWPKPWTYFNHWASLKISHNQPLNFTPLMNSFMSEDLPLSISQRALLLCTQNPGSGLWSAIRVWALCSGSVARGLEAAVSVSVGQPGESAPCQRLVRPLWPFHNPLQAALLCPLFHNERRSPSRCRSAPPQNRAHLHISVRACELETASVSGLSSKTDSWQSSLRTLLLLVLLVKVQRRSPSRTFFFFSGLRSQAAEECFPLRLLELPITP